MTTPDRLQLIGISLIIGSVILALLYLRGGPGGRWNRLERLARKKFGPRERLTVLIVAIGGMSLIAGIAFLAIFH